MISTRTLALAVLPALTIVSPSRADDWKICAAVSEEHASIDACSKLLKQGKLSRANRATVHMNRGAAYLNSREYELALKDLNESLHLSPDSALTYYNRGATYYFMDENDKAVRDLSRALKLDPSHANSRYYRGRTQIDLGNYDEAIEDLSAALALDPELYTAYRYRGLARLRKDDAKGAITDLTTALRHLPKDARAYRLRGEANWIVDRLDAALNDLEIAARLDDTDSKIFYLRARVQVEKQDYEAALKDYTEAIRLNPKGDNSYAYRAATLINLGRLSEAVADADIAISLVPKNAVAHFNRGEALRGLGRKDEALASYRAAVHLDPSLQQANERIAELSGTTFEERGPPAKTARTPGPIAPPGDAGRRPSDDEPDSKPANRESLIALQGAYNTVGLMLLKDLAVAQDGKAQNFAYSPLSIGMAMAMTAHGADGETADEMRRALQHNLSRADIVSANAFVRSLLQRYAPNSDTPGRPSTVTISLANALATGPSASRVSGAFLRDIDTCFGAEMLANASLSAINRWVQDKTNGRIGSILEQPPGDDAIVLLNALFMQARWASPFDSNATVDRIFLLGRGDRALVPTMSKTGSFGVARTANLRGVVLPYADPAVAMMIVVPDDPDRFVANPLFRNNRESAELVEMLSLLTAGGEQRQVTLRLPRFRVSSSADLINKMQAMGMRRAFEPGRADFSNLTEGKTNLVITQIVHKAMVDVAEAGTEAAAATAVVLAPGAGRDSLDSNDVINVDRPFLFFIGDKHTGSMLFAGRVADPRLK